MRALLTSLLMVLCLPTYAAETPVQAQDRLFNQGRALFNESCAYCHNERGHATALLAKRVGADNAVLERRTNLHPELIRHVVRHGINSMPWYRRAELSDGDLDSIIDYLTRANSK